MGRRSPYTAEFRRDAVALVRTSGKTGPQVARDLGISAETLRNWVKQDRIDRGHGAPGELTTAEQDELRRLRRENAELRLEREILKKVSMAAGRPPGRMRIGAAVRADVGAA